MESWTLRSPMIFVNSSRGSFPQGSYYTPVVVWDAPRNRFLAWVSYFLSDDSSGCLGAHCPPPKMGCPAGWYVAESTDGIRDCLLSRGLGDVYKRQPRNRFLAWVSYFLADDSSGCLGAHCPPPKMGCPAGWFVAESTDLSLIHI